ncbi:MAG TPA: hypothetical protein PLO51_05605 [Candidatus Micrarchaeota archaeon]|nr:hypothetical protein [Candidatus Micrarchaeota archaeon]
MVKFSKDVYLKAAIGTVMALLVIIAIIWFIDDQRQRLADARIQQLASQAESTRLFFLYGQYVQDANPQKICNYIDFATRQQMDKGYYLVTQLKDFENANLLSDYQTTRDNYYLSNVELWIYTLQQKKLCNTSDTVPIVYFTNVNSACPQCSVQGNVLDQVRTKCKNARVITVASDIGLDIVELMKSQYNVTMSPTILIGEDIKLEGLQSEDAITSKFDCKEN